MPIYLLNDLNKILDSYPPPPHQLLTHNSLKLNLLKDA